MADTKKKDSPRFRVTQAPGFFDGTSLVPVGTEIAWEVPDGWDVKKNGPHFMSQGPSQSFEPLNAEAIELQEAHKARIDKAAQPSTSEVDELKKIISKQNDQFMQMMEQMAKLTAAQNAQHVQQNQQKK